MSAPNPSHSNSACLKPSSSPPHLPAHTPGSQHEPRVLVLTRTRWSHHTTSGSTSAPAASLTLLADPSVSPPLSRAAFLTLLQSVCGLSCLTSSSFPHGSLPHLFRSRSVVTSSWGLPCPPSGSQHRPLPPPSPSLLYFLYFNWLICALLPLLQMINSMMAEICVSCFPLNLPVEECFSLFIQRVFVEWMNEWGR